MSGGPAYDLFVRARQVLKRQPGLSDAEVFAALGLPERIRALGDGPGSLLDVVRQARRDVEAGDLA